MPVLLHTISAMWALALILCIIIYPQGILMVRNRNALVKFLHSIILTAAQKKALNVLDMVFIFQGRLGGICVLVRGQFTMSKFILCVRPGQMLKGALYHIM